MDINVHMINIVVGITRVRISFSGDEWIWSKDPTGILTATSMRLILQHTNTQGKFILQWNN